MARAKRHYIPGYIWHITHRCHKREFLLKFSKDRHRWLQWLYQARKRYGLMVLNYFWAKGRKVIEGFEGNQLRERSAGYDAFFGAQKDDIALENTYRWDINTV